VTDLLTELREHDLPPKWDGRAVLWEGWSDQLVAHVCPPPKEREVCAACGSLARAVVNRGLLAHRRGTTLAVLDGHLRAHRPGKVGYWVLYAWRCPGCKQDVVWDVRRDEWWDLDFTDYGDAGSADPDGRW
jgi:hypothetical protein